ncbi:hypothetical protein JW824_08905 [bacterium]|nr:hypothetical protein [bacterium]
MKRKSIKIVFMVFILVVSDWHMAAFTQQNAIDQQRMNRDLRIMEGILNKLLQRKSNVFDMNNQTKAIHLSEFGVVFYIRQSLFSYTTFNENIQRQESHIQETLKNYESALKALEHGIQEQEMEINTGIANEFQVEQLEPDKLDVEKFTEALNLFSEKMVQEEEEMIEKLKGYIVLFFRNYASAIGQLQSQDRIVILVDLRSWESMDSSNEILTGWVSKQDVDRYRQKQIDESDFEKRVHFQFAGSGSDIHTDIGILLEIFGRAIETSAYWGNSSNMGVYLEGMGALIFMEIPQTMPFGSEIGSAYKYILNGERVFMREENGKSIAYGLYGQRLGEVTDGSEDTSMGEDEYAEKIQNELFDLVASYGHTLRLQPEEWIVLNVSLGSQFIGLYNEGWRTSFLIMKLKKKDVDDYYHGAITLHTLKERSIQQTY